MNLITIFSLYPDQEACIEHLETVRWRDEASCPYCGSASVARKAEKHRIGRWELPRLQVELQCPVGNDLRENEG